MSVWVVWKMNRALGRCGDGWMDLRGSNFRKWTYHDAYENKQEAEAEAGKIKTLPSPEKWLEMDSKGPGGVEGVDAICRPVGHNPNQEGA